MCPPHPTSPTKSCRTAWEVKQNWFFNYIQQWFRSNS